MLLWCLIRQNLRESKEGFNPDINDERSYIAKLCGKSSEPKYPFKDNWYKDPCPPVIGSVMTAEEQTTLHRISPGMRPTIMTRIRILAQKNGDLVDDANSYVL